MLTGNPRFSKAFNGRGDTIWTFDHLHHKPPPGAVQRLEWRRQDAECHCTQRTASISCEMR